MKDLGGDSKCGGFKLYHVSVLVKRWTWIPDNLDNLYSYRCVLSCLWTKSNVLVDKRDVLLFEISKHQVFIRDVMNKLREPI